MYSCLAKPGLGQGLTRFSYFLYILNIPGPDPWPRPGLQGLDFMTSALQVLQRQHCIPDNSHQGRLAWQDAVMENEAFMSSENSFISTSRCALPPGRRPLWAGGRGVGSTSRRPGRASIENRQLVGNLKWNPLNKQSFNCMSN